MGYEAAGPQVGLDYTEYDTRLGAYAVVIRDEHVLLALWNEPTTPLWTLPGGGVEFDEPLEIGAVREVREETGYGVALGRLLGVETATTPGPERLPAPADKHLKVVRVVFEAEVITGELAREVNGTTDEARWIPLAEVESLPRIPLVDAALAMWRQAR